MLYPALDYPPPTYIVPLFYSLRLPDEELLSLARQDAVVRLRIVSFLRRWISSRRHQRQRLWAAFLAHYNFLPDPILGASNILMIICTCL